MTTRNSVTQNPADEHSFLLYIGIIVFLYDDIYIWTVFFQIFKINIFQTYLFTLYSF